MNQAVLFKDTGIGSDSIDRVPLKPGMKFMIAGIAFKESEKYEEIAYITALTPQEDEKERSDLNYYTTSKVLVSQLHKIATKYGNAAGGLLNSLITVEVESRTSQGALEMEYMSFC